MSVKCFGEACSALDFTANSDHVVFGTKAMDELWSSPRILNDFANDSEYGVIDTLVKENLNGFLFQLSDCKRDGILPASDETYCNENEYKDSVIPCINASEMRKTDPNLYADDNVSENELPELIVCYKDMNCYVKDICIDEIRYKEDKMMMESYKSASEIYFGKDTSKECRPSLLIQTGEANCRATGKVETDVSEEGCFVNRTFPVEEFGAWISLRSFLHNVPTLPDQRIPSGNAISDDPSALLVETEPNRGAQCISNKESNIENHSAQSFKHKDLSYEDLSPNGHVQYVSSEDRSTKNANEQALEAQNVHDHEHEHKHGNSASFSFISRVQCDEGESSFSAADVTIYSGPIAYSRSLSVQSDSSTTSTQSFTFPVLQFEWKSSPVRMAKADARHFQKHRSWKTGLLCCRF